MEQRILPGSSCRLADFLVNHGAVCANRMRLSGRSSKQRTAIQDDSPIVMRASMTLSKAPALVGRFAGFSFWATAPLTTISIRSGTFY